MTGMTPILMADNTPISWPVSCQKQCDIVGPSGLIRLFYESPGTTGKVAAFFP